MSWNQLYSGKHWSIRSDEAQRVHDLVASFIPRNCSVFRKRVDIFITAYFKNRPFDPDNICAKYYIDGLKGRVISDDTPKEVGFVALRSEVDENYPRIEIELK